MQKITKKNDNICIIYNADNICKNNTLNKTNKIPTYQKVIIKNKIFYYKIKQIKIKNKTYNVGNK